MAVTTSYPGIYIEELPNLNHSVTAAPTSVTVFVGYSHPFKTPPGNFGKPVEIFSFSDYMSNFGGFFDLNPWLPDYLGNAVFQFFANGGSDAWVVGLEATEFLDATGKPVTAGQGNATLSPAAITFDMSPAAAPGTVSVTLTAQQPGGIDPGSANAASGTPARVQFANRKKSDPSTDNYDLADIIITQGTSAETYRGTAARDIAAALAQSALVTVTVTPAAAGDTPGSYPASLPNNGDLAYPAAPPPNATLLNTADYAGVFQAGAPLDVDVKVFNLMVLPGISPVSDQQAAVLSDALAFCEKKRAFFIMDAPPNATTSAVGPGPAGLPPGTPARVVMDDVWNGRASGMPLVPVSPNGAIYFPYLQTVDPVTQQPAVSPPSGYVAGIFAMEDAAVGVGKAPAGLETTLQGTTGVIPWGRMTDMQQGVLNLDGVNCLREFPGLGPPVVFGARTLVSSNTAFQQWKYIPVRRTALFIEQSLYASLGWAVFQPNDTPLWNALTQEVEAFMLTLFRQGSYFQGSTPSEAFLVQCDATTTTPTDQQNGVVNILVGFAPLKPAEFVVIQIAQLAGQSQA
ncbi:MAG TPA: phage tail sheath C-terminal domain-containing protein [Trebonia sp.]|nr:phage tail sheath C-terminal domain-containing protein [Trebonia sp.]